MATITGTLCEHATLSGTTVDTVTLTSPLARFTVINRAAVGGVDLAVTVGKNGVAPSDPTQQGDNTYWIPPQGFKTFRGGGNANTVCKILGNANAYSVEGEEVGEA